MKLRLILSFFCLAFFIAGALGLRQEVRQKQQSERAYETGVVTGTFGVVWPDASVTLTLQRNRSFCERIVKKDGTTITQTGTWFFITRSPDREPIAHYQRDALVYLVDVSDPTVETVGGRHTWSDVFWQVPAQAFHDGVVLHRGDFNFFPFRGSRGGFSQVPPER